MAIIFVSEFISRFYKQMSVRLSFISNKFFSYHLAHEATYTIYQSLLFAITFGDRSSI